MWLVGQCECEKLVLCQRTCTLPLNSYFSCAKLGGFLCKIKLLPVCFVSCLHTAWLSAHLVTVWTLVVFAKMLQPSINIGQVNKGRQ